MNQTQIATVNKLARHKHAELKQTIKKWLQNAELDVDDFIANCKSKNITVPGDILNALGLLFSNGKEDFEQNTETAFKLYLLGSEQEDGSAAGNCALYYSDGRAPGGKNLSLAAEFCQRAIDGGANDRCYLMAQILYEKDEYSDATKYLKEFLKIPKQSEKNKKKARNLEIQCLLKQLRKIYENVSDSDNDEAESEKKAAAEAPPRSTSEPKVVVEQAATKLPGWTKIASALDGFNISACNELISKVKLLELEERSAKAACDAADQYLETARADNISNEIIKILVKKQKALEEDHKKIKIQLEEVLIAWDIYSNPTEQLLHRQTQVELRFFDPRRTQKKKTFTMAIELEKRRLGSEALEPLLLGTTKIPPARNMVTAERSTMEASVVTFGYPTVAYTSMGWSVDPDARQTRQGFHNAYKQDYTFTETVQIGNTLIKYKQRTDPHYNHLGDYSMNDLGTYRDIVAFFNSITETDADLIKVENEKKLAELMLKFTHDGLPVELTFLQIIKAAATNEDVDQLNRIFYHCFVKEVARWMIPKEQSHRLPLAIAQARALQLIIRGHLTIADAFAKDARFGVFTGTNIGDNVEVLREKIIRINKLYDQCVTIHDQANFIAYNAFCKKHDAVVIMPSREILHKELQDIFGGASDTDGEGYDSEQDESETTRSKLLSKLK